MAVNHLKVVFERRGEEVTAVDDISLSVGRGETLALVGESGCGKTTFGLALTGLLLEGRRPPRITGEINVLGTDLISADLDSRRALRRESVHAVFQDPTSSLNPTMRIGHQLREVTSSDAESIALLEQVGIVGAGRRLRSYPHELSGGQRQRVMIAMALGRTPALIVADEPTTALDVTIQAQLLQLIVDLRNETQTAFVFVTHDLGVAAQVADRIAVIYSGRVVELGSVTEVLERPSHPYTIALLRSRITMEAARNRPLPALGGEPPSPRMRPSGCSFAPRCAFAEPRCLEQVPPLVDVQGTASQAACLRADELGSRNGPLGADAPEYHQVLDPGEIVLKLNDVGKTFRMRGRLGPGESFAALRSVDLELRQGECLGIVGESGCGKSTLLRVIAGLTKADGGSCVLAPGAKAQMVFQDAGESLTPWLSVGEQIGERLAGDMGRQARRDAVTRALEAVGLSAEVAGARPRQLSGGQKQRVALARAIVVPPALLLCDEPTSSLDVSLAATVLNLIADLRQKLRMTVVFVTHDLAAARLIADRIAVMYLGRIVELGPAEELVGTPGHPYTKALIAAVPGEHHVRPKAKGELPDPVSPPPGCPYHPRCAEARPDCSAREVPLTGFGPGGLRLGACVHLEES